MAKCKWSEQCDGCPECDSVDKEAEGQSFRAEQTDTAAGTETIVEAHADSGDCEKLTSFVGFILVFSFFSI